MSETDAAKRLRWAFGLALLLHAAALGAATRLPDAAGNLSQEFEGIRVFGSATPGSMSRVELVEWPSEAPTEEAVQLVALEPESAKDQSSQRKPVERAAKVPPQLRAPQVESVPPTPIPAENAPERRTPAAVDSPPAEVKAVQVEQAVSPDNNPAGGGGGGGGGFVDLGSPSTNGTLSGVPSGGTPAGEVPGKGAGAGTGVGPGAGGGSGGGSGGGTGIGQGTGVGEGSGSGTGGGEGEGGTGGGFNSRIADRREPEVIWKGTLEYPTSAVRDGAEGTVRLKVLVSEKGSVVEAEVVESSGDRRLDAAAREFVLRWRYRPAVQDGEPRQVHTHARVRFELN